MEKSNKHPKYLATIAKVAMKLHIEEVDESGPLVHHRKGRSLHHQSRLYQVRDANLDFVLIFPNRAVHRNISILCGTKPLHIPFTAT